MFSWRKKTAEVQLAGRMITLSPLDRAETIGPFREFCEAMKVSSSKPISEQPFGELAGGTGFILLSARTHHPDLRFEDVARATTFEVAKALAILAVLSIEHLANGGTSDVF
jgi:hypothetical protein